MSATCAPHAMEPLVRRHDGHDGRATGMYNCLPLYHSVGGVVATGRDAGQRRLGGDPREVLRAATSGTTSSLGLHDVPVYRRAVPLPGERAAASATRRAHRLRLAAATACGPTSGTAFKRPLPHPANPGVLRAPPKATSRCSISTASPARSAASRRSCAHRFPIALVQVRRRDASEPVRDAGRLLHPLRRRTRSARPSARSANDGAPAARFEGYADPTRPRRRSCATCSSRATPGSAPAT